MLTHNSMLSLSGDAIWNISCSRQLVTTIQRHSAIVVLLLASSTWFCLPLAHTCCCCPGPVLAHSPASSSHRPHQSQWSQEPVYACPGTYNSQQVMLRKRDPLSVPSPLSWATNTPATGWLTHHGAYEISALVLWLFHTKKVIVPLKQGCYFCIRWTVLINLSWFGSSRSHARASISSRITLCIIVITKRCFSYIMSVENRKHDISKYILNNW